MKPFKIGIFDSGIGGLTVMKAIMERLPGASIAYFGDTARLPYGDKSPSVICRYTRASLEFLHTQDVAIGIIACNTASAYAIEELRTHFSLPIVDVIAPSAAAACHLSPKGRIGVLGTTATIRSGCYQKQIHALRPSAEVSSVACPLLVPLVEEGMLAHPATALIIRDYLKPLHKADIDTVILGCTHYPLLHAAIAAELGPEVHIVDSASSCAQHTLSLLSTIAQGGAQPAPTYQFFVSDHTERFCRLATAFLPTMPTDSMDVQLRTHD